MDKYILHIHKCLLEATKLCSSKLFLDEGFFHALMFVMTITGVILLLIMNQYACTISFRNVIFICLIMALSCTAELQDCELSSSDCNWKEDTQTYICNTFYGPVNKSLFRQFRLVDDPDISKELHEVTIDNHTIRIFWNILPRAIVIMVSTCVP